ncbi:MAG: redoxin domain-containing protein, partial [Armatimonadetes bacterium]|nr:redoxin domain-containing protein [Armatimonadota bacterium]
MTSWDWPRVKPLLLSLRALATHEFRMTLRGRSGLSVALGAGALAFADAALRPQSPLVAGVRASLFGCGLVLVPLSLALVAGAARRDDTVGAGDVVQSRPFPTHLLFVARFLGTYTAVLALYAVVVACSLLCPLVLAREFASPLTFVHAFGRGIVPLLFIVALGYCGVAVAGNVLAAAIVALYWLYLLLWGDFLARVFNFSLTQNWPIYGALALSAVLGTAALRRFQDLRRSGVALPLAAAGLLVLGLLTAWNRVVHSHDKPLHRDPLAMQLAAQYAKASPRVPGVWLPDQHGRLWRTSSTDGKVLVLAFWSPHDPDSMTVLDDLRTALKDVPRASVACLAVCLADDHALSAHVASEGRYPFTMVTDTGTHFSGKLEDCAPLAEAFELAKLPSVYVTDRGHRLVADLASEGTLYPEGMAAAIGRALAVPVPPG